VERASEWPEAKPSPGSFDKRWSDLCLYADSFVMSHAVVDAVEAKKWQPRIIVLGNNNAIIQQRGR